MNRKSKILLFIIIISSIVSIVITYYKTMILENYEVINVDNVEDVSI